MIPLIRQAWSAETSADPAWSNENPALGQCAVTAILLQDILGGELLRGMACGGSHYWNRLADGVEVDVTREQFPAGTEVVGSEVRSREYVLSFAPTLRRYLALRSAFLKATRQKERT